MSIESIIEVANGISKDNISENKYLDTLRVCLEPYIYHHLIATYSKPLSDIWLNYIPPNESKYAYVIVERRCHPNFEFILQSMAWANPRMSVYIFCSKENINFITALLGPKLPHFNIIQIFNDNVSREQGKQEYNNILTSKDFYNQIKSEYILTIQMDVIIRQPIPESIFCGDYWGSPWGWKQHLPGGGGSTIRKISTMRSICREVYEPDIDIAEDDWICTKIMNNPIYSFPNIVFRSNTIMENMPTNNPILLHQFWTFFSAYSTMNKADIIKYWKQLLTLTI